MDSFENNKTDAITQLVAYNTQQLLTVFNADIAIQHHANQSYVMLLYNHKYVARIIEGCNAMSVVILFISFIVSFSGKLKTTFIFIIAGSIIIYILNVIRIALLSVMLYYFPEKEFILHGVFFPLFIYGVVFILWLIWVNKYSLYAKNNSTT